MKTVLSFVLVLTVTLSAGISSKSFAADDEAINVWPDKAPGETKVLPPESDTTTEKSGNVAGRRLIRLGNVSTPTLTIYRPDPKQDTGTSVVICPGGGHNILALDLEGTEVAEWLTSIGVTGIVLKYRVPAREPTKRYRAGVQDAQRSMSLVRANAKKWKLNEKRIGICGFSAGGEVAGLTSFWSDKRTYKSIDDVDKTSCRPDFAMLIYPAYMADRKTAKLRDDVVVPKNAPPTFFVHAFDDPVTPLTSVLLFAELKKQGIASELHVYSKGGHGYGLRKTDKAVTTWPTRAETWLKAEGLLSK
jgi:acetyl esterase/lipase